MAIHITALYIFLTYLLIIASFIYDQTDLLLVTELYTLLTDLLVLVTALGSPLIDLLILIFALYNILQQVYIPIK